MTSADTFDATVHILIDAPDDGMIESWGWVRVTSITATPDEAKAALEREFPASEQGAGGEGMHYVVCGQEWLAPDRVPEDGDWSGMRWRAANESIPHACLYWRVELRDAD